MCSTLDLNSVFNPLVGSVETSTVSFLGGAAAFSSGLAASSGGVLAGATPAGDPGCSAGFAASGDMILFNSRVTHWSNPGPFTTVVSLTKPVPGTNHRSNLTAMREAFSE